jgi:5-formyltetrahydrofolate cyclo-ligase
VQAAVEESGTTKEALRATLRARRARVTPDERHAASVAVCDFVARLPAFARARTVALYAALPAFGELDVRTLADALRIRGATVLYPRVASRNPPRLAFHVVDHPHALRPGVLGIDTPSADAPQRALDNADLVIVPGLAFDAGGHRLGFGGGYYDAALASAPRPLRVSVAYSFQLLADALPRTSRDLPVDVIVTPDGARPTGARPDIGFVEVVT